MAGKPRQEKIVLTDTERRGLAEWRKDFERLKKAALGVEIIRETARGRTVEQIAAALKTTRATVSRWRAKFKRQGLAALAPARAAGGRRRKAAGSTPLEADTGYVFVDRALLAKALTHRSYVNERRLLRNDSNERLEFLGDAVLSLAVSHELVLAHPDASEGELSRLRAALVNEQTLYEIASLIDLGGSLKLGRGEELTGGRAKPSILADAFEALVGAAYLDGGFDAARALVRAHVGARIAGTIAPSAADRDYKTRVQELAQEVYRTAPAYRVVGEQGPDHEKVFEVECVIGGEVYGRGEGRSKKEAAQRAAEAAEAVIKSRRPAPPGPA